MFLADRKLGGGMRASIIMVVAGIAALSINSLPVRAQTSDLVPRWGDDQPSFDCATTKTAAARLICADVELARLDRDLGAAFQKKKLQVFQPDQSKFVADELSWIRDRNARCGLVGKNDLAIEALASSKPCLLDAIRERIAFLGGVGQRSSVSVNSPADGNTTQSAASQEVPQSPMPERTFDQSKIAELLDKRDPTNQTQPLTRNKSDRVGIILLITIGVTVIGLLVIRSIRSAGSPLREGLHGARLSKVNGASATYETQVRTNTKEIASSVMSVVTLGAIFMIFGGSYRDAVLALLNPPPTLASVPVNSSDFATVVRNTGCDSRYSDERKEEFFNSNYRDHRMQVYGQIVTLGNGDASLKVLPESILQDIVVAFADGNTGYHLIKGSWIRISFRMTRGGGCFLPYSGDLGEVLQ
jgi:uncharacterized protein